MGAALSAAALPDVVPADGVVKGANPARAVADELLAEVAQGIYECTRYTKARENEQ